MFFVNIWFKTNWAFNVWTVVRHAFAPQSVSKPANVGALNISKRCVRSSKAQGRGCIMCCVFRFSRDLCPIRFCGHATCHSCDYGHGMFFATMVTVCFCDHGHGMFLRPWSRYVFATMVAVLLLRPWSRYCVCDHGRSMVCDHGHGMACDHGHGMVCDHGHGMVCDHGRGIRFFRKII